MITIHAPYIQKVATGTRLCAKIVEDALTKTLWYEVDDKYADGLSTRSDAFVVALLYWAMCYHHDITCEAPLTESLHYQLQHVLCPTLAQQSTRMYAPKIHAPLTREPLPTQYAVGTGCSGGIDSFHVIAEHYNDQCWPSMRLTHLCTFAVGHMYETEKDPKTFEIVAAAENRAQAIADDLGLEYIRVRSNYNDEFPHTILYTAGYVDMACVHALGKLFGVYFCASDGCCDFKMTHAECEPSSHYDPVLLPNLSTPTLAIYSEGAGCVRYEKIKKVAELPATYKWLNVCCQELRYCGASDSKSNRNCGVCDKCQLTLLDLEALGLLDRYSDVFDLDAYYSKNRHLALRYLLKCHLNKVPRSDFAWSKLHHDLTLADWWSQRKVILRRFRNAIRSLFKVKKIPTFKDPRKGTGK